MNLYLVQTQKDHGPRANPVMHRRTWAVVADSEMQAADRVRDSMSKQGWREPVVSVRLQDAAVVVRA